MLHQHTALIASLAFSLVLSGCLSAPKTDPNISFDAAGDEAIVVGSIARQPVNDELNRMLRRTLVVWEQNYKVTFRQYDPATQRLIPNGGVFEIGVLNPQKLTEDPVLVHKVPAGHYILSRMDKCVGGIGNCQPRIFVGNKLQRNVIGYTASDADTDKAYSYRVRIEKGKINNLGLYRIGPYRPEWSDNESTAAKTLASMPNISGQIVYNPPKQSRRLGEPEFVLRDEDLGPDAPPRPDLETLREYILNWAREDGVHSYRGMREFLLVAEKADFILSDVIGTTYRVGWNYAKPRWRTCATIVYPSAEDGKPPKVAVLDVVYPKSPLGIRKWCHWYRPSDAYKNRIATALARRLSGH